MTMAFDLTRGVDILRGARLIAHFDGADALDQAFAMAQGTGLVVRYWLPKGN